MTRSLRKRDLLARRAPEPLPIPRQSGAHGVSVPVPVAAKASVRAQVTALRSASPTARRAMGSAYAGFCIDMFDVYAPIVALAPAIAYFQPTSASSTAMRLAFYATFAATLFGRPVGAVIFGHYADRIGRRRLALVAVGGFSTLSLLIACLPGFATWGWGAPAALIVLRLVNGVFLGGEYTSATPLAFEHCPPAARGLYGGLLQGAFAVAYIAISIVVLALLEALPHHGLSSAYVQWGWRLPFAVGGLLGLAFLLYRRRIPESAMWERAPRTDRPVREILLGSAGRDFWQVFLVMSGMWFVSTSVVTVMPTLLLDELGLEADTVTGGLLLTNAAFALALLAAGVLGQRIGRRRLMLGAGVLVAVVAAPLYVLLSSGRVTSTPGVLVLAGAVLVLSMPVWAVATPYLNERFRTAVRSSGFGMGYTLAVGIPSFYSAYMLALGEVMPFRYTQIVLLLIGAALLVAGARLGPETVDVRLDRLEADQHRPVARPSRS